MACLKCFLCSQVFQNVKSLSYCYNVNIFLSNRTSSSYWVFSQNLSLHLTMLWWCRSTQHLKILKYADSFPSLRNHMRHGAIELSPEVFLDHWVFVWWILSSCNWVTKSLCLSNLPLATESWAITNLVLLRQIQCYERSANAIWWLMEWGQKFHF